MGRFRDIVNNSTYGRAAHGNVRPLVIETLGNALMPGVGTLLERLYTRHEDRANRRNSVPFSPSQTDSNAAMGGQLRGELGITDWGGTASPPGAYGPLMSGYAGLPNQRQVANAPNTYDPEYADDLIAGYLHADPQSGGARESGGGGRGGGFGNAGIGPSGAHGALGASARAGGIGGALASRIGSMVLDAGTVRPHHNRFSDKTAQR